jgi:hypothetical protein
MAKANDSLQVVEFFLLPAHLLMLLGELYSIVLDLLFLNSGSPLALFASYLLLLDLYLLFLDLFLVLFEGINEQHTELVVFDAFDLAFVIAEGKERFDALDVFRA